MAGSDHAHGVHSPGNAQEAIDVGTYHVIAFGAELGCGFETVLVDFDHDFLKTLLGVIEGPGVTAGVLLHFQCGGGDTTGVGGFTRAVGNFGVLEQDDAFRCGRHVGAFRDRDTTVFDQSLGVAAIELVLGCTGQSHVARYGPDVAVFHVLGVFVEFSVGTDAATFHLFDALESLQVDALLVHDHALGVRAGDHLGTKLVCLFNGVDGHVAGAGNHNGLAVERVAAGFQHFLGEEHGTVAGCFGTGAAAAPVQALAGEYAGLVTVGDALVLAKHVTDFTATNADVTGRDVCVLAQVAVQFGHHALAEAHDFVVRFALRIEVAATFTAADGQAGQGVLEDLLEAQELDDAQVDGRVETHAALVGPQGAVEFNTESTVDVDLAAVVLPGYTEDDLALWFADALDDLLVGELGVLHQHRPQSFQHFMNRLVELFLTGVAVQNVLVNRFQLFVEFCCHGISPRNSRIESRKNLRPPKKRDEISPHLTVVLQVQGETMCFCTYRRYPQRGAALCLKPGLRKGLTIPDH